MGTRKTKVSVVKKVCTVIEARIAESGKDMISDRRALTDKHGLRVSAKRFLESRGVVLTDKRLEQYAVRITNSKRPRWVKTEYVQGREYFSSLGGLVIEHRHVGAAGKVEDVEL